jgi:hypothetical protein
LRRDIISAKAKHIQRIVGALAKALAKALQSHSKTYKAMQKRAEA